MSVSPPVHFSGKVCKPSWDSYRFSHAMTYTGSSWIGPWNHTLMFASNFCIGCKVSSFLNFLSKSTENPCTEIGSRKLKCMGVYTVQGRRFSSKNAFLWRGNVCSVLKRFPYTPFCFCRCCAGELSPPTWASPQNRLCQENAPEIVPGQKNQSESLKWCQVLWGQRIRLERCVRRHGDVKPFKSLSVPSRFLFDNNSSMVDANRGVPFIQ